MKLKFSSILATLFLNSFTMADVQNLNRSNTFESSDSAEHAGRAYIDELMVTNEEFSKNGETCHKPNDFKHLASGQNPKVIIVACSDSRVAPEILFRKELGELFVVRTAGNVISKSDLASVEYSVAVLGSQALAVIGHESCGAVEGAMTYKSSNFKGDLRTIGTLLEYIRNGLPKNFLKITNPKKEKEETKKAIIANAENTLNTIYSLSPMIHKKFDAKEFSLATGYFKISTGKVEFISVNRDMAAQKRKTAETPVSSEGINQL